MFRRLVLYIIILLFSAHSFLFSKAGSAIQSGITAFENGNLEAAVSHFTEARMAFPDDPEPVYWLGRIEMRQSNPGDAVDFFEDAVKLKNDNPEYHFWLGNAIAANIHNVGRLRQLGHARRMRRSWQKAIELDPDYIDARFSLLQFYLEAPGIAGGGRDKALAEVEGIRGRDKNAGRRAMAQVYLSDQNYTRAADEYQALISESPDDVNLRYQLGGLYQLEEDWENARVQFNFIISSEPEYKPALYQLGRTALLSEKHMEEGAAAFRRYLEFKPGVNEPSLAWAHTRLGQLLVKMEQAAEAREHFESALSLEQGHEEARKALQAL